MVCIYCGHETEVTNSRPAARLPRVWRRRVCKACVAQFTTNELPDFASSMVVQAPSGALKPFLRDKLFLSVHRALSHREDALSSATELTNTAIGKAFRQKPEGSVLPASLLAKVTLESLRRFDPLAGHTYKAYHQRTLGKSTS